MSDKIPLLFPLPMVIIRPLKLAQYYQQDLQKRYYRQSLQYILVLVDIPFLTAYPAPRGLAYHYRTVHMELLHLSMQSPVHLYNSAYNFQIYHYKIDNHYKTDQIPLN